MNNGHIKKFYKYFFDLNVTQLIYLYIRNKKQIYPFKNMHIAIRRSAKISGSGLLVLGRRWRLERFYPSQFIMDKNSNLCINGDFLIYTGCDIRIHSNGTLTLGDGGYMNKNGRISCFNKITIGKNVIISENFLIRDSDNHHINGKLSAEPITIEDNVWIGLNVTILNGVTIGEGSVIAAGSVVVKDIPAKSLAAGCPAVVKKTDIQWH